MTVLQFTSTRFWLVCVMNFSALSVVHAQAVPPLSETTFVYPISNLSSVNWDIPNHLLEAPSPITLAGARRAYQRQPNSPTAVARYAEKLKDYLSTTLRIKKEESDELTALRTRANKLFAQAHAQTPLSDSEVIRWSGLLRDSGRIRDAISIGETAIKQNGTLSLNIRAHLLRLYSDLAIVRFFDMNDATDSEFEDVFFELFGRAQDENWQQTFYSDGVFRTKAALGRGNVHAKVILESSESTSAQLFQLSNFVKMRSLLKMIHGAEFMSDEQIVESIMAGDDVVVLAYSKSPKSKGMQAHFSTYRLFKTIMENFGEPNPGSSVASDELKMLKRMRTGRNVPAEVYEAYALAEIVFRGMTRDGIDHAQEHCKRALRIRPTNANCFSLRAFWLLERSDWRQARTNSRRFYALNLDTTALLVAAVSNAKLGDLAKAKELAEAGLSVVEEASERQTELQIASGTVALELGELQSGVRDLQMQQHSAAYHNIAIVHARNNNCTAAMKLLDKIDPQDFDKAQFYGGNMNRSAAAIRLACIFR